MLKPWPTGAATPPFARGQGLSCWLWSRRPGKTDAIGQIWRRFSEGSPLKVASLRFHHKCLADQLEDQRSATMNEFVTTGRAPPFLAPWLLLGWVFNLFCCECYQVGKTPCLRRAMEPRRDMIRIHPHHLYRLRSRNWARCMNCKSWNHQRKDPHRSHAVHQRIPNIHSQMCEDQQTAAGHMNAPVCPSGSFCP